MPEQQPVSRPICPGKFWPFFKANLLSALEMPESGIHGGYIFNNHQGIKIFFAIQFFQVQQVIANRLNIPGQGISRIKGDIYFFSHERFQVVRHGGINIVAYAFNGNDEVSLTIAPATAALLGPLFGTTFEGSVTLTLLRD